MANSTNITFQMVGKNEKLLSALNESNKKLKDFKSKANKHSTGLQNQFKKLGGLVAGAFAVTSIVSFGKEATKLASEMQGVAQAFGRLDDSKQVLINLQAATRGTVSELELMKNAIKADNFGIPLDVLAKGLEFATKRAAQTGESVDYLVDSFTTGLGRKSVLILDNLGISASDLQDEIKKTGDFMLAVGNITDRELTKMGDVILTDAQKMAQFAATVDNAKVKIGNFVIKALGGLLDVGNKLITNADKQSESIAKEQTALENLGIAATAANTPASVRLGLIEDIEQLYPGLLGNLDAETISNEQLKTAIDNVNQSLVNRYKIAKNTEAQTKLQEETNKALEDQDKILQELTELQAKLVQYQQDPTSVKLYTKAINKANEEYVALTEQIADAEKQQKELVATANELSGIKTPYDEAAEARAKELADAKALRELKLQEIADLETKRKESEALAASVAEKEKARVASLGIIAKAEDMITKAKRDATFMQGNQLLIQNSLIARLEEELELRKKIRSQMGGTTVNDEMGKLLKSSGTAQAQGPTSTDGLISGANAGILKQPDPFTGLLDDSGIAPSFLDELDTLSESINTWVEDNSETLAGVFNGAMDALAIWANMLETQKNKELKMANGNAKKEEEIARKYANKQKGIAIGMAIINGAQAVLQALGSAPPPLNFILAAITGVAVATQIGAIASQTFAQGGVVQGTSYTGDKTPVLANAGEMILNRGQQANLFNMINSGGGSNKEVTFRIGNNELIGTLDNYAQRVQTMR